MWRPEMLKRGDRVVQIKNGKTGICTRDQHTATIGDAVFVQWDAPFGYRPPRPNLVSLLRKIETEPQPKLAPFSGALNDHRTHKPVTTKAHQEAVVNGKPTVAAKLGSIGLRYDARQKLLLAMDEAIAANDDPAMTAMMTEQRNRAARTFGQA